jgi:hypothetical protein
LQLGGRRAEVFSRPKICLAEQSANTGRNRAVPKNRSRAAYKAWILTIARRFTTKADRIELTEQEWLVFSTEYW